MLQNIPASKIKQSRVPMFLSRDTTIHGVHFQQRILSKQSQRYRKKLDENRFQQRGAPIVRSKSIVHSRPSTRNPLLIPFNYNRTPFIWIPLSRKRCYLVFVEHIRCYWRIRRVDLIIIQPVKGQRCINI